MQSSIICVQTRTILFRPKIASLLLSEVSSFLSVHPTKSDSVNRCLSKNMDKTFLMLPTKTNVFSLLDHIITKPMVK